MPRFTNPSIQILLNEIRISADCARQNVEPGDVPHINVVFFEDYLAYAASWWPDDFDHAGYQKFVKLSLEHLPRHGIEVRLWKFDLGLYNLAMAKSAAAGLPNPTFPEFVESHGPMLRRKTIPIGSMCQDKSYHQDFSVSLKNASAMQHASASSLKYWIKEINTKILPNLNPPKVHGEYLSPYGHLEISSYARDSQVFQELRTNHPHIEQIGGFVWELKLEGSKEIYYANWGADLVAAMQLALGPATKNELRKPKLSVRG